VEFAAVPSQITVVTNDRLLANSAQSLGAATLKIQQFLKFLKNKSAKVLKKQNENLEKKFLKESDYEIKRLLKIFEKYSE
jgi:predicted RNA-binding protein with PIN domain